MGKNIFKQNFLTVIRNSEGTEMFRNYFNLKGKDILSNGDLSCAFFVSTVLLMFGFLDKFYFRVVDVVDEMEKNGWQKVTRLRKGCIVVWNPVVQNGRGHFHIGFYLGNRIAISNRSSIGKPGKHPVVYSGLDKQKTKKVTIRAIYWHPKLG